MCGYYLHRAQITFFQTSLAWQPCHQTPAKMLHDHTAAHKLYGPNDVATITESYVYVCIHEGMHVLIVTQE